MGLLGLLYVVVIVGWPAPAMVEKRQDWGRATLGTIDGWAALGDGTTGGAAATMSHVYTVTNRQAFIAALHDGNDPPSAAMPSATPKIIYIQGTIDANVGDNNQPLTCEAYQRDGYTLAAFLADYAPDGPWGRVEPSGLLEEARQASQRAQAARIRISVGSNTTMVGLGKNAVLRGVWLDVAGSAAHPVRNVIIRNLTFQDTYDCFPQWQPNDGNAGAWNARYDAISLRHAEHIWIDHNVFAGRAAIESEPPTHFGTLYEQYDGQLDITEASDLVTVSWNRFLKHNKTLLIGDSDQATSDRGHLRVTIHHNLFDTVTQRAPRVRFGQVHLYNNDYKIDDRLPYISSWGIGVESALYAENNCFEINRSKDPNKVSITLEKLIKVYAGNRLYESGTCITALFGYKLVNVRAAYNAVHELELAGDVGWRPTLFTTIETPRQMMRSVEQRAGLFFP